MWYPPEFYFFVKKPQYWGPGTDLESAGSPVSSLDRTARTHDIAYASSGKGRSGRVRRAQADLAMAASAGPGFTGAYMFGQGMFRVFTFNLFDLPWD